MVYKRQFELITLIFWVHCNLTEDDDLICVLNIKDAIKAEVKLSFFSDSGTQSIAALENAGPDHLAGHLRCGVSGDISGSYQLR